MVYIASLLLRLEHLHVLIDNIGELDGHIR